MNGNLLDWQRDAGRCLDSRPDTQVADIARRLSAISEAFSALAEDFTHLAPAAAVQLAGSAAHKTARSLLRLLGRSKEVMGIECFGDPALMMLLDLFVAEADNKRVSVSSLCVGSGAPSTTALRYIDRLEENGLMMRYANPSDRRSAYLELTPIARISLADLLKGMA